jgi:hypothetical protein
MTKKSFDIDGLDPNSKNESSKTPEQVARHAKGVSGDALLEAIPHFIKANNEQTINGSNNTWIILGRDRPSSRLSGYGGKGHTQAGAIDIVVGRMGPNPKSGVYVDPNFEIDSARIYISQKTDVDKNFRLANGKVGPAEAKSAIALKADGIRIIAREGIKLVTGTDPKNSQGGIVDATFGIDLIAGNMFDPKNDKVLQIYTEPDRQKIELMTPGLEPIPKGISLALALDQIVDNIDKLSGIVSAYLKSQMEYNAILGTHFHISPFFGMPTTPSETAASSAIDTNMALMQDCIMGIQKFKATLINYKNTHLRPHGQFYINSSYHNLN